MSACKQVKKCKGVFKYTPKLSSLEQEERSIKREGDIQQNCYK